MRGVCRAGCIVLKHRPYCGPGATCGEHTHLEVLYQITRTFLSSAMEMMVSWRNFRRCSSVMTGRLAFLPACHRADMEAHVKKRGAHDGLLAHSSYILVQQRLTVVFGQSAISKEMEKVEGLSVLRCLELHQHFYFSDLCLTCSKACLTDTIPFRCTRSLDRNARSVQDRLESKE